MQEKKNNKNKVYGKNSIMKIFIIILFFNLIILLSITLCIDIEKLEIYNGKTIFRIKVKIYIFKYIKNCGVPKNGENGGWDVIYKNPNGIEIIDGTKVHTVYVEMKNKHNTMNSASAGKTFIKMQNQLLNDDDCACFLVEAIAQHSQNIKWETTVDKKKVGHKLIRRVSIDQFYSLVTGQNDAFFQMCMVLPEIIKKSVKELEHSIVPHDTVYEELLELSKQQNVNSDEMAFAMAVYMLGFGEYIGFHN